MNRYKFTNENIAAAIKFLKKKSDTGPPYAVRFKADLAVKGKQLLYKGTPVVSTEKLGDVLRKEIYKKHSKSQTNTRHRSKSAIVGDGFKICAPDLAPDF